MDGKGWIIQNLMLDEIKMQGVRNGAEGFQICFCQISLKSGN